MGAKPDGDETISKKVLDWLTAIVTFTTILAGILGLFLRDNETAERYSWGLFIPFAMISVIVLFYRYYHTKKLKIAEPLESLAPTAALRGPLPFEEGDQLPGRGIALPAGIPCHYQFFLGTRDPTQKKRKRSLNN